MEKSLAAIAEEEVKLRDETGCDDSASNLKSRVGSYAVAVILSVAKLMGRGNFDEALSKGKLFATIREALGELNIHMERLVGSRGDAGIYGNALCTLILLLDSGDWGMHGVLEVLSSIKSNKLYGALQGVVGDHMVYAVLRVLIFLNTVIFRPIHTFAQNPATTQAQMIKIWKEYRETLEDVGTKTWSDFRTDSSVWCDTDRTQLMGVSSHTRVLHRRTTDQRKEALKFAFDTGNLDDDGNDKTEDEMKQLDGWCNRLLQAGVAAALESWDYLCSEAYSGGLMAAKPGTPLYMKAAKLPATSTIVENYIGEGSYREQVSRNQKWRNRNFQMAMSEANVSEKLRLLRKHKPRKFARIMSRSRQLRPLFIRRCKRQQKIRVKSKIAKLGQQRAYAHALHAKRVELRNKMEGIARLWQADLTAATSGSFGVDAIPRTAEKKFFKVLIKDMLTRAHEDFEFTPAKLRDARMDWVCDRLFAMTTVHEMHRVVELNHVFYGGRKKKGQQVGVRMQNTEDKLLDNLVDCSIFILSMNTPAEWSPTPLFGIGDDVVAEYDVVKPWASGLVAGISNEGKRYTVAFAPHQGVERRVEGIAAHRIRFHTAPLDGVFRGDLWVPRDRSAFKQAAQQWGETHQYAARTATAQSRKEARLEGLARARAARARSPTASPSSTPTSTEASAAASSAAASPAAASPAEASPVEASPVEASPATSTAASPAAASPAAASPAAASPAVASLATETPSVPVPTLVASAAGAAAPCSARRSRRSGAGTGGIVQKATEAETRSEGPQSATSNKRQRRA